jgi:hypothetical protein
MSTELLPVWSEIEKYINSNISIIPVRDKDDDTGVAKQPYGEWKKYQRFIIDKDTLFDLMDVRYNTTAIAMICGLVSGNMEVIDIDVKYKPGIDAILFQAIKTLYPDIFEKLRIHKSPSGGYHIIYRCEEPVEGNQKLAKRPNTPGKKPKEICFIETRGEGGYVLAPPSMDYKVVKNASIPVLTGPERESLLSLCRSYNEIVKVDKPPKPSKADDLYYDTNPFEDFNNRVDPTELTENLGWKYFKSNNQFIWYTRPGKSKGVSMSFNLQKRFFYCFTASTELEESHGYTPANLLAAVQFDNDKKKLYQHLVSNGYGKIKPQVEERLAKKAAINGNSLAANASEGAKKLRDELERKRDEMHPYGVYWIDSVEGVIIDRELLYLVADKLGFRLYKNNLVRIDDTYIEYVQDRYFFDMLKEYIKEEDANFYRDICNSFESFIEKHGKFTISRMTILPEDVILKDTKEAAYKVYYNGVLKITADKIELLPRVPKLIWKNSVRTRDYKEHDGGRYCEYLKLATNYNDYLLSCIGYLAHEYKDETMAYIIVLTEEVENPKDGGGAGKNVFSALLRHITSYVGKPGSQVKYDEKFMQSWNRERVMCISDVPKSFNFSFLKELSSGEGLMKKLFKDEVPIAAEDMPKFIISSNFSFEVTDGGLKRRIKQIEFTDFFTKAGGIDVHFGVHFPNEWDAVDWNGFDTLMAKAIQTWLKYGRKIGEAPLSETGWAKQFEQTWGQVIHHFIKENFDNWTEAVWVSNTTFNETLEKYYHENNIPKVYQPSMVKVNGALKDYCAHREIEYQSDVSHRGTYRGMDGIPAKHRKFGEEYLPF